jgi:hypothetical protein
MSWNWFLALAVCPDIVFRAMAEKPPAELTQRRFQFFLFHF